MHYDEQADLYYGNRFSSDDAKAVLGLGILSFFSAAMLSSEHIPAATNISNSNRGVLLGYDKDREAIYSGGLRSEMDIKYDIYMNPK
ncbi:MAG: hypothetical protein IPM68_14680 [Flavobacteriales bacterium]|nr:hypothetical protein [Flavobacteriales bacterium]